MAPLACTVHVDSSDPSVQGNGYPTGERCPRDGLSTREQQRLRTAPGPVHRMDVVPAVNDVRRHPAFILWAVQELHGQFRPARDPTPASA